MPRRESTALAGGPAYVQATDDGAWLTVDRATGDRIGTFDGPQEALDSLLAIPFFGDAVNAPIFRDNGKAIGSFRWLDAAAEEAVPFVDGSQVTVPRMRTMIDRHNTDGEPCMIDGGTSDSRPHESAKDSTTRANGWAHVAAEWREPGGRVHIALYAELHPDIAPDVESGRLAKGSILFSHSKTDPAGARLLTHALTNRPVTQGLVAAPAFRHVTDDDSLLFARAHTTRTIIMSKPVKKSAEAQAATVALRAAGYDLKAIADAILSLPKDATCEQICKLCEATCAAQAALDPSIVPAAADAPVEMAAEPAADAAKSEAAPEAVTPRAVPGFDSPEAQDAFAAGVIEVLKVVFPSAAESGPAGLLEALKSAQDLLAGAVASGAKPAEEAAAGGTAADANATAAGKSQSVPEAVAIGRDVGFQSLAARAVELQGENETLRVEIQKRDLRDSISKRFGEAKLVATDEQIEKLVGVVLRSAAEDRDEVIDMALRAANVPSTKRVEKPSIESVRGAAAADGDDFDAKLAAAQAAVDKEHGHDWPRARRAAEAYSRARAAAVSTRN